MAEGVKHGRANQESVDDDRNRFPTQAASQIWSRIVTLIALFADSRPEPCPPAPRGGQNVFALAKRFPFASKKWFLCSEIFKQIPAANLDLRWASDW